ncbi:MAG TPA: HEAT repeat domain-containing protein, partial [Thermoanaerobaculia bacterium]
PTVRASPYKFLDFYTDTEQDQRRFGGREREIRELVARIANEWTLVLYGRSGIGKTSLLLAGIFPELKARGYLPIYARTLTDPIRDLCEAIDKGCGEESSVARLRAAVGRAAEQRPVIIVLDQFEEFFIRFRERPEIRSDFITAVAGLVNDKTLNVTVVFSLREDYLAELDDFREEIPDLFTNQYRLRGLTAFGVRQSISRPLIDSGIPFEEAVISRLVDQLEEYGFDPAALQILCSELHSSAQRRGEGSLLRITLSDMEAVGSLDDIFLRYLDALGTAIPQSKALLARMVLDHLITGDNTKKAVTMDDLLHADFSASAEEVEEVLSLLLGQRLVRQQMRGNVPWYELIHERLIPHLKQWLDFDSQFYGFRQARDFVQTTAKTDVWLRQSEALLNSGVLTGLLGPYKERFSFQPRELDLIFRSTLYRAHPDVGFWSSRFGARESVDILIQFAGSPQEAEREGAVIAARRIEDPGTVLPPLCFRLALTDPSERVRRSAAFSLAKIARDEEIEALRSALDRKESRRAARQVLTNLLLAGHPLKAFTWITRRFAHEDAERRLHSENQRVVQARRTVGIVQGLAAGIAWITLLGFPLAAFGAGLLRVSTDAEWHVRIAAILGLAFPAAGALGATLGGIVAYAVAQDAALGKDGRWFRAIRRSRPLFYGIVASATLSVPSYALFFKRDTSSDVATDLGAAFLISFPIALFSSTFLAFLIRWNRNIVWPSRSRIGTWCWSFLGAAGSSGLLIAAPFWTLSILPPTRDIVEFQFFTCAWALGTSLVLFVSLVAAAESDERYSYRKPVNPSRVRRRLQRSGAAAGTLVLALWVSHLFTPDMIPPFAQRAHYDSTSGLFYEMATSRPGAHYFRICNSENRLRYATSPLAAGSSTAKGYLPSGYYYDSHWFSIGKILGIQINRNEIGSARKPFSKVLAIPPGCSLGSMIPEDYLALPPVPSLQTQAEGATALATGGLAIADLTLKRIPDPSGKQIWTGVLEGTLPYTGTLSEDFVVNVSPKLNELKDASPKLLRLKVVRQYWSHGRLLQAQEGSLAKGQSAEPLIVLSPLPTRPALIKPEDMFWPTAPDSNGHWWIEFQATRLSFNGERPPSEIRVPTLVQVSRPKDEGPQTADSSRSIHGPD